MKQFLFLIVAGLLVGCGPKTAGSATSTEPGASPTKTPASVSTKPAPPQELPEELKSEAYHWFGLSNPNPVNMEVSLAGGITYTGTQAIALKTVGDGRAEFEITRSGTLGERFGNETVELRKDGIYDLSSTVMKTDSHPKEMPSALPVGASWTNSGKFDREGQSMELNQTLRVARMEDVQTKAGKQSAMLVTSDGTMTSAGAKSKMQVRSWYVKDKGLVKMEVRQTDLSHKETKPTVITFQEIK